MDQGNASGASLPSIPPELRDLIWCYAIEPHLPIVLYGATLDSRDTSKWSLFKTQATSESTHHSGLDSFYNLSSVDHRTQAEVPEVFFKHARLEVRFRLLDENGDEVEDKVNHLVQVPTLPLDKICHLTIKSPYDHLPARKDASALAMCLDRNESKSEYDVQMDQKQVRPPR